MFATQFDFSCFQGVIGLFVFILIAWLLSENRSQIDPKSGAMALLLQIFLILLLSKVPFIQNAVLTISQGINKLKDATVVGTSFVFGYLGGGSLPFELKVGGNPFVFAFQPLPMVMVVSALSMLLFHWGLLPIIVRSVAWIFQRTLKMGGALGVAAAAKVFLGQTDVPLLIRPYLSRFSRSEIFTLMSCGMATTSGTIMVLYSTILEKTIAHPLSHILTVSVISIPAAIFFSRIMVPPTEAPTSGHLIVPYDFRSSMEAIAQGTTEGLKMFLNILAMLIVALSLVALINIILQQFPLNDGSVLTLEKILGWMMCPLAWCMGIPWEEAPIAGQLLGAKTVMNEVVAFLNLAALPADTLSEKTRLMMTYALCGFANLSSIGIVIGTFQILAPERGPEVISLGVKSVLAGTLSTCLSGLLVGLLWHLKF